MTAFQLANLESHAKISYCLVSLVEEAFQRFILFLNYVTPPSEQIHPIKTQIADIDQKSALEFRRLQVFWNPTLDLFAS